MLIAAYSMLRRQEENDQNSHKPISRDSDGEAV